MTNTYVEVELLAEGTVQDYDPTAMASPMAQLLNVSASMVTVTVTPGSVLIVYQIDAADSVIAGGLKATLSSRLSSVENAEQLLGVPALAPPTITQRSTVVTAPEPISEARSILSAMAWAAIIFSCVGEGDRRAHTMHAFSHVHPMHALIRAVCVAQMKGYFGGPNPNANANANATPEPDPNANNNANANATRACSPYPSGWKCGGPLGVVHWLSLHLLAPQQVPTNVAPRQDHEYEQDPRYEHGPNNLSAQASDGQTATQHYIRSRA